MSLVYIAGSGRSGSTLLARALGGFESAVNVGELCFFWDRGVLQNQLCGCGLPFRSCPFWGPLADDLGAMAQAPRVVSLQRSRDRVRHTLPRLAPGRVGTRARFLASDRRSRSYVKHLSALYEAVSRHIGDGSTLVDASKSVPYLMSLRGVEGLDISVIHIVRDSRSVAMSWKRHRVRPEITESAIEMPTMSASNAAFNWIISNGLADRLSRIPDIQYLRVRYEDFVARPLDELSRLATHLDLDQGSIESIFTPPKTITATADHTVSGNPSRFEQGSVSLRADSDWGSELSPAEARLVTAITAPLLLRYGYRL